MLSHQVLTCLLLFSMKPRKLWKIVAGLLLITAVIVGLTGWSHPILFKWLSGSARIVGRPINAKVYTDGQLNSKVKVYHVKKFWNGTPADYFILHFPYAHESRLQYMILNRQDHYVGVPSSTSTRDYDQISGILFQSETGAGLSPMQDEMKGFNFNPGLLFEDGQITLHVPPKEVKFDSIRVVF